MRRGLPTQKTMFNTSKSISTWGWLWQRHFAAPQANELGHRRKPNSIRLSFRRCHSDRAKPSNSALPHDPPPTTHTQDLQGWVNEMCITTRASARRLIRL
jgi:hypothetical protein